MWWKDFFSTRHSDGRLFFLSSYFVLRCTWMSRLGEESLTVNVFSAQAEDEIFALRLLYST